MSDENQRQMPETKAKTVAKPAIRAFPENARVTPQPRERPKAPTMPPPKPREGTIEAHLYDHNAEDTPVPAWKHAAARAKFQWPNGAELSRADYDKAIENVAGITIS